jgi:hypothetical protein
VPPFERGDSVGAVLLGVFVSTGAQGCLVHKPHCRRQAAEPRIVVEQVPGDGAADAGQPVAEFQRPGEFLLVLLFPPDGVVQVLAAAGVVRP